MITQQQATALAEVLAMIRPNDWRPNQTVKVFAENWETTHPFSVIAEVSVRAANDHAIRSPSGIFLPGKHWEFETRKVVAPAAPKCPDHPEEQAHHCRACLADVKAGERDPNAVGKGGRRPRKPKPPPSGWRPTYGDRGTTSPTKPVSDDPESIHATDSDQQLQNLEALGATESAPQDPGRTFPHSTPAEPPSTPKNPNGATP